MPRGYGGGGREKLKGRRKDDGVAVWGWWGTRVSAERLLDAITQQAAPAKRQRSRRMTATAATTMITVGLAPPKSGAGVVVGGSVM